MIIQIRGTHGSGKSGIIYGLIKKFGAKFLQRKTDYTFHKVKMKTWAMEIQSTPKLYVVGKYTGPPSGGCDNIDTVAESLKRIKQLAKKGNVIFEGAKVADVVNRIHHLENQLPKHKFIYGFLDTPLEKCIKRIRHRRKKHGIKKKLYPEKSVIPKFKAVAKMRRKMKRLGMDCLDIPHKDSVNTVLKWLKGGK